ncbi:MAG: homoserine kinase [Gemmatimonadaceae bacterium]|nr:homoserine kinase [Gemmatimonadaceae bacterium]
MTFLLRATAHASGSIGNLGPGLDVLGAAITGAGDSVTAEWWATPGVVVLDSGHPDLPTDVERHASALAARAVLRMAETLELRLPPRGIALTVRKGLPLSGGQGGSAASAVAGAVAVNALIGSPLERHDLLSACLSAEEALAGRHLDNIAPSLIGGICLIRSLDPMDVVSLPVPPRLRVVLAHPDQHLRTAEARAVLPATLDRRIAVEQMANVAAVVAALHTGDLPLLGRALHDQIAEPPRRCLIPGFDQAKEAALEAGALGASISGAGPTTFALCDSDVGAHRVAHGMRSAYERAGVAAQVRVARVDVQGVRVDAEPAAAR